MSIESNIDRNRAKRLELSLSLKEAHKKAEQVLSDPDNQIQESEFVGVYSSGEVQKDLAEVKRLETVFKQDETPRDRVTKQISEILEAIILTEGELSNWFGEASTLKTSKFDDFKNKTDLVSEWRSPEAGSHLLALAVDVTFGEQTANTKLRAIRDEIDKGTLGTLRYFKDVRGDFMGIRNNIPRVVIGVSQESIEELARLWMQGKRKELGAHPVQRAILEEIYAQLRAMRDYAKSKNQLSLVESYQPAIHIIKGLVEEKRSIPYGELKNDAVLLSILENTARVFSK